MKYANERNGRHDLSYIQLLYAKDAYKKLNSNSFQLLRNWWQRSSAKCSTWFECPSLVTVTDGLLDSDGAMVDVPVKRFGGSSEEVSGMWFGPRLGKRNKRSVDSPWTVFTVRGKFVFTPDTI
jgi:hypothetical protein